MKGGDIKQKQSVYSRQWFGEALAAAPNIITAINSPNTFFKEKIKMKVFKERFKETLSPDVRDYGDHLGLAGTSLGILTVSEMRIYPNDVAQQFLCDCSERINWSSLAEDDKMDFEETLDAIAKEHFVNINLLVSRTLDVFYATGFHEDAHVNRMLTLLVIQERLCTELVETVNWLKQSYSETPEFVFEQDSEKINEYFNAVINKRMYSTLPQKFMSRKADAPFCSAPTLKPHAKVEIELDLPSQDKAK